MRLHLVLSSSLLGIALMLSGVGAHGRSSPAGQHPVPAPTSPAMTTGLVIVKATNGDLKSGKIKDVTTTVAKLVVGDQVRLTVGEKLFGDPAPGVPKALQVDYTLNGKKDRAIVAEKQTLSIGVASKPATTAVPRPIEPTSTATDKNGRPIKPGTEVPSATTGGVMPPPAGVEKPAESPRLVIVKATWGPESGPGKDVTKSVQGLVVGNKLNIDVNEHRFGAGITGQHQYLVVDYLLDGRKGTRTVIGGQQMTIGFGGKPPVVPASGATPVVK